MTDLIKQVISDSVEHDVFTDWLLETRIVNRTGTYYKLIILVGSGNNGKTTLIKHITSLLKTEKQVLGEIRTIDDDIQLIWFQEEATFEWNSEKIKHIKSLSCSAIMEMQITPEIPDELRDLVYIIHADNHFT
jgi:Ni2+-binding GTPase involved in maturation of urease and hydrogenase